MKSWGFSRMRKQWIPGHFSLRPRGLGTRLKRSLEQKQLKLMHKWQLQTMTDKGRLLTDGTVEFASGNRQCILTQACPPPMINHLTSLKKLLVHVVYPWPSWQACACAMGIFFFFARLQFACVFRKRTPWSHTPSVDSFWLCRLTMANTPPLFGDLGKTARDIFDKGFGMMSVLLCLRYNVQLWIAMCL